MSLGTAARLGAAEQLTSIDLFAFGGVGFASRISDGERAFRVVMENPHDEALQPMETVFANGTVEAKSYALAGIHILAPARFNALYQSLAHSQQKVREMQGCVIFEPLYRAWLSRSDLAPTTSMCGLNLWLDGEPGAPS